MTVRCWILESHPLCGTGEESGFHIWHSWWLFSEMVFHTILQHPNLSLECLQIVVELLDLRYFSPGIYWMYTFLLHVRTQSCDCLYLKKTPSKQEIYNLMSLKAPGTIMSCRQLGNLITELRAWIMSLAWGVKNWSSVHWKDWHFCLCQM